MLKVNLLKDGVWSTAKETLETFEKVHGKLDYAHNMIQISMDGLNVNWKMLDLMKEEKNVIDEGSQNLLEIGSCGFHVLHGAFKTAQSAITGQLEKFLKACHSIFKKSLTGKSTYFKCNDLH